MQPAQPKPTLPNWSQQGLLASLPLALLLLGSVIFTDVALCQFSQIFLDYLLIPTIPGESDEQEIKRLDRWKLFLMVIMPLASIIIVFTTTAIISSVSSFRTRAGLAVFGGWVSVIGIASAIRGHGIQSRGLGFNILGPFLGAGLIYSLDWVPLSLPGTRPAGFDHEFLEGRGA